MPLRVTLPVPLVLAPNDAKTCIFPVLVSYHCSLPPLHLAIGASMSYLWHSSWLFKDKGPLMVFTWEQVSKCQFRQFIFHVRIEMSPPSIMLAQSVQNRIYFSPCENICTSYVFFLVCVNERSAFGQCRQLKRDCQFSSCIYSDSTFKAGELVNYTWTFTWFCIRAKKGQQCYELWT